MPKNRRPNFKQYISTRSAVVLNEEVGHDHDPHDTTDGPSVRELLNRSRAEAGPSTGQGRGRGGGEWNVATSCMPLRAAWPDDHDTNPTTNTPPSRRVAGPAPPPSWRSVPKSTSKSDQVSHDRGISRKDLVDASSLLRQATNTPSPVRGLQPLSHYIYRAVIRYLESSEVYCIHDDGTSTTWGQFLRNDVGHYRENFKSGLLANHSSHPTPRLSDQTIQAVLLPPSVSDGDTPTNHTDTEIENDSWDEGPLNDLIHHLGITLHPDPYRLLRSVNLLPTVALTSIDLAYSAIPSVDKLVGALPSGMKELGLVGVRCPSGEELFRMLGMLGKRLKLLHVSCSFSTCDHLS